MTIRFLSLGKRAELSKRFEKFHKFLHIKPFAFSEKTLFLETNIQGYFTYFNNSSEDNIKACIEALRKDKYFNFGEKTLKEIEKELRKIHQELLDEVLVKEM